MTLLPVPYRSRSNRSHGESLERLIPYDDARGNRTGLPNGAHSMDQERPATDDILKQNDDSAHGGDGWRERGGSFDDEIGTIWA